MSNSLKMITFIQSLYKKYKVLSKLSQKENNLFQQQLITLLVDENENIDMNAYNKIKNQMGIDGFILQILPNVIERNTFSNHYQVNKNISTITEQLQKKTTDLMKRTKLIQKKEAQFLKQQSNLKNKIKEFSLNLEKEAVNRISVKETQMKKQINALLNQLKSKQKLILQRKEEISINVKKLQGLEKKEKQIQEKVKYLQKNRKNQEKQVTSTNTNELKQLKTKNEELMREINLIKKKNKTTELAYKKAKQSSTKFEQDNNLLRDKIQKLMITIQTQRQKLTEQHQKQKQKGEEIIIDELQLSQIIAVPKVNSDLKKQIQIQKQNDLQEESLQIPQWLHDNTLQEIDLESEQSKKEFMQKNTLPKLIQKCKSASFKKDIVISIFDTLLQLIQQGQMYAQIISYLNEDRFIQFFQTSYLNHESNVDIVESITLVMSRIALSSGSLEVSQQFKKAIKLRARIEQKNSMLGANLDCLLKYIY